MAAAAQNLASAHDLEYHYGAAVTPSDANDVSFVTRAFYVGGTGDVACTMVGGPGDVTLKAVPAGTLLRIRTTRIKSTGTTATSIVALW